MLGYIDAVVILVGIVVTVGVMEYPHRVHLATGILLTLVAGVLLWANLRQTRWAREFSVWPPVGLDPVAASLFCRGWPLPAFLICPYRHMQFEPNNVAVYAVLVVDAVVYVVSLLIVRGVGEFCFRRRTTDTAPRATATPPRPASRK